MKNEELISIIIPVYNSEKYLQRCIDSIKSQTYNNIEILLIDDGSTDNSLQICKENALKDSRIEAIHKKNTGVSDTRNVGIAKSKGKYISFIDSDDYIEKNYIKKLYNAIIDKDVAICQYKKVTNKNYEESLLISDKKDNIIDDILNDSVVGGYCWNKLYKREKIVGLKFNKKIKIMEDLIFNLNYFKKVKRIGVVNEALYNYVIRNDSVVHRKEKFESFEAYDIIIGILNELNNNKKYYYMKKYILDYYKRIIIDKSFNNNKYYLKVKKYEEEIDSEYYNLQYKIRLYLIKKFKFIYYIKYKMR